MSRQPVTVGGRSDAAEIRNELLGKLGLRASASDQDVESAHDELVEFLDLAPHEVRSWAAARSTDVDEAYALLSGPEQDLVTATQLTATAAGGPDQTSPTRAAAPTPSAVSVAPAASPATPLTAPPAAPARKPRRNQLIGGGLVLVVAAVVFGVYFMGRGSSVPGISGTPTATATTASGPTPVPIDPAKVAALTKKITANPKDTVSLQSLGDIYFAATDYKTAIVWEQKVIVVDPKNQVALLALGAAQFNQGNPAAAKKAWVVAEALYPKNAEVHYDLGFLYMSQSPPDTANMTIEWKKVVAIAPKSALAATVEDHLTSATAAPTTK
jgi:tetratricopeptide (TPR) repeat protein